MSPEFNSVLIDNALKLANYTSSTCLTLAPFEGKRGDGNRVQMSSVTHRIRVDLSGKCASRVLELESHYGFSLRKVTMTAHYSDGMGHQTETLV
ncbi:hypothetical protein TNIN_232641 [Trichonephila inaurata madagascariensis]|uniref:Uncharacterized protein n=1 Tax=Trichonephila inaurata madagascariensis TaxID=2747483 RepID=A0A8X6JTY8_9ARAC|nr:hypothetical protein TNIN_232641 [Trichonephila inaurata madagascariensis]